MEVLTRKVDRNGQKVALETEDLIGWLTRRVSNVASDPGKVKRAVAVEATVGSAKRGAWSALAWSLGPDGQRQKRKMKGVRETI